MALGCDCDGWEGIGCGTGREAAGRDANLEGPPPGPPGRSSLPDVMALPGFGFPFGVGRDMEFGGSPWLV